MAEVKLVVLMQNDYPIGVFTTAGKAAEFAHQHYQDRYKRQYPSMAMQDFHYRQYEFTVDEGVM